jgi:hypothetical protein
LFEKTKPFFDKWWKQILALIFQQYTLFITISIFGFIVMSAAQSVMSFPVSCKAIINLTLLPILCTTINICIKIPLFFFYVADVGANTGVTLVMAGLFLWMLSAVYASFVQKLVELGSGLITGASAVGGEYMAGVQTAWDKASSTFSDVASSVTKNAYNSLLSSNGTLTNSMESINKIKQGDLKNVASGLWGLTGGNITKGITSTFKDQGSAVDRISKTYEDFNKARKEYNSQPNDKKQENKDDNIAKPDTNPIKTQEEEYKDTGLVDMADLADDNAKELATNQEDKKLARKTRTQEVYKQNAKLMEENQQLKDQEPNQESAANIQPNTINYNS